MSACTTGFCGASIHDCGSGALPWALAQIHVELPWPHPATRNEIKPSLSKPVYPLERDRVNTSDSFLVASGIDA